MAGAFKRTLRKIVNILSGRRAIRKTLRKQKLEETLDTFKPPLKNYKKVLRTLEKKKEALTKDEAALRTALLTAANLKSTNVKPLLNRRTRVRKFFNRFLSPTSKNYKERSIEEILNTDVSTLKRIFQKRKNTRRVKTYKKPVIRPSTLRNTQPQTTKVTQAKTTKATQPQTTKATQAKTAKVSQVQQIITHTKPFQPVNLTYHNNACFIETAIQMFYRVPEFKQAIANSTSNSIVVRTLKEAFERMTVAEQAKLKQIDIDDLLYCDFECLPQTNPLVRRNREQQDVSQFINNCILERLTTNPRIMNLFKFEMKFERFGYYNQNFASPTLLNHPSQSQFTVKKTRPVKEPTYILLATLLGLPSHQKYELQNVIEYNFSPQNNDPSDPELVQQPKPVASKVLRTPDLPADIEYLLVSTFRARGGRNGDPLVKLNKYIEVDGKYFELQGAICQQGTASGGHFVYVWRDQNEQWWYIDDRITLEKPNMIGESEELRLEKSPFISFTNYPILGTQKYSVGRDSYVYIFKRVNNLTAAQYNTYRNEVGQHSTGISVLPLDTI